MAFKFTFIGLALCSLASAGLVPAAQVYHAAAGTPVLTKSSEDYDPNPQYKFAYDVQDAISGDSKSQTEQRDGDVVQGEYSLNDSDGYKRTVQYTADPINGFNAVVHREPLVKAVAVKAAPVPVAYASAPAVYKSSHLAYAAAPAAQVHYAAAAPAAQVHYAAAPAAQVHYAAAPAAQVHYAAATPAQFHYAAASPAQLHYATSPAEVHYAAAAPTQIHYSAPTTYYHH